MNVESAERVFLGTGRHKMATARVRMRSGSGKIIINGKDYEEYCFTEQLAKKATRPLQTVQMENCLNIEVNVSGGGVVGQAAAIAHGISRALQEMEPGLRQPLKQKGHLTRDSRVKERKKAGRPGARKRFQFSKR